MKAMSEKFPLAGILRAVLAEDRTLLSRREELLAAMEQRVTPELMHHYRSFQQAIQSSRIGELFLSVDGASRKEKESVRLQSRQILQALGMQKRAALRVEETIARALDWPPSSTPLAARAAIRRNGRASAQAAAGRQDQLQALLQRVAVLEEESRVWKAQAGQIKMLTSRLEKLEAVCRQQHPLMQETAARQAEEPHEGKSSDTTAGAEGRRGESAAETRAQRQNEASFTERYNALSGMMSVASASRIMKAMRRFLQDFSVEGFSCAPDQELRSGVQAAAYMDTPDAMHADFWAAQVEDGLYAVVPNAKLTFYSTHRKFAYYFAIFRDLRTAFGGDFVEEHIYFQMQVERSALFSRRNGSWSVAERGRLRLTE